MSGQLTLPAQMATLAGRLSAARHNILPRRYFNRSSRDIHFARQRAPDARVNRRRTNYRRFSYGVLSWAGDDVKMPHFVRADINILSRHRLMPLSS